MNTDYIKRGSTMVLDRLTWLLLGHKNYLKINFRKNHGYPLDLKNPRSFFEKIQWIKVYGHLERYSKYVDKCAVREFVRERIGEGHLIPLIGVYDRVEDIDFSALPDSFVMKATHGSSWNFIIKDKSKADLKRIKKRMSKWLRANYYTRHGEANYKPLKGRVIIEKYLEDPSGEVKDYKIFCHNGEPVIIRVDSDRYSDHKQDLFDSRWNRLPVVWAHRNSPQSPVKPEKLDELLDICRKLTRDFNFVRADLYCTGDQVYFGELTFTPGDGMVPLNPPEFALVMGELIDIENYND